MNNIRDFDILKIKRGRKKECQCKQINYELDEVNKLVFCTNCGAIIDNFTALLNLAKIMDTLNSKEENLKEQINNEKQMLSKVMTQRIKMQSFKNLQDNYLKDLYPYCPKCDEVINPTELTRFHNIKYLV